MLPSRARRRNHESEYLHSAASVSVVFAVVSRLEPILVHADRPRDAFADPRPGWGDAALYARRLVARPRGLLWSLRVAAARHPAGTAPRGSAVHLELLLLDRLAGPALVRPRRLTSCLCPADTRPLFEDDGRAWLFGRCRLCTACHAG